MKRINFLLFLVFEMFLGCSAKPDIRIDLDTYLRNTGQYSEKNIIITTSIEDLQKRYDLYKNRGVEVTGLVVYYGDKRFWTWYILLDNNGKTVRCYAHQYKVDPGVDALHLVRWAQSEKGEIIVEGKLRNDGIEIVYLKYKGDTVTPYYKPPDHYSPRISTPFR
jgi:hypothetical protein